MSKWFFLTFSGMTLTGTGLIWSTAMLFNPHATPRQELITGILCVLSILFSAITFRLRDATRRASRPDGESSAGDTWSFVVALIGIAVTGACLIYTVGTLFSPHESPRQELVAAMLCVLFLCGSAVLLRLHSVTRVPPKTSDAE